MSRATLLLGLGLFALFAPATAPAVPSERPANAPEIQRSLEAMDALDFERLLRDRAYAGETLAHLDRLAAGGGGPESIATIQNLRIFALMTLERKDEARALIELILAQPMTELRFYIGVYYAAFSLPDPGIALRFVEQASREIADVERPQLRALLRRDSIFPLLHHFQREADEASRVRLAEALLRIGWPGPMAHEESDAIRAILIRDRLRRGDRAAAVDLTANLSTPSNLAPLIVQRRFDTLFPQDTDRLARFRRALEAHDRYTAEAVAAAPQDTPRVIERTQLLRVLGRDADALALLGPFTRDVAATVAASDQGMWLVNEAAYSLVALGRKEEGAALMARLAALPIDENPSLISVSINYAALLHEVGRHADALSHVRLLQGSPSQFASAYGKMWISSTEICSLASLGRPAEAAPALARMRTGSDDNPAALLQAYLCLDDMPAAEALLIAQLESDDPERALLLLQDYQIVSPTTAADPLLEPLLRLRARPAVRAAVERVGRILPLPVARTYWGSV